MGNNSVINEILNEVINMNKNGFTMWFEFSGHVNSFKIRGYKGEYRSKKEFQFDVGYSEDLEKDSKLNKILENLRKFKGEAKGEDIVCKKCGESISNGSFFKFCPFCAVRL